MTASLQPINPVTAPSLQGDVVPLDGSQTPDAQTFSVTSSNPDIAASVASGPFWTINVQYTDPNNGVNDFKGPLTFQLFQQLTPIAVNAIQTFTNDGYYNGKTFHRVVSSFPGPTDYVVQGGAPNPDGTGNSFQPGTPFNNEPVQQLAFAGKNQLGLANAGPNTNDTQFFISTGSPNFLDYNYTLFGQFVAGAPTLARITQVPVKPNPRLGGENSLPVNPVSMSTVTLSATNPNGALILDTTQARAGETATITVTATDSLDSTSVVRTFNVTVGAYAGPKDPPINFRPLASPITATVRLNSAVTLTLQGQSGYPDPATPATLSYAITAQPSHGTISQFNAVTGNLVYTPNPGYLGGDTFQYQVNSTGPLASPATLSSNPTTVAIGVKNFAPDDFDGDGKTDPTVYRQSQGLWVINDSSGGKLLTNFGDPQSGDIPVPGDYLGLGTSQLAVFRPSTDTWYVQTPGGGTVAKQFGDPTQGDVPVPADYEGVGHVDLALFRAKTETWIIRMSDGSTVYKQFGDPAYNDLPVPGDYEGIGKADLALFRPGTGQWIIRTSDGKTPISQFGDPAHGDIAVPGDYDGDGKTDLAIFRPGTALFVIQSSSGGKTQTQLGDPSQGDLPVAAPLASLKLIRPRGVTASAFPQGAAARVSSAAPAVALAPPSDPGSSPETSSVFGGGTGAKRHKLRNAWLAALDDLAAWRG